MDGRQQSVVHAKADMHLQAASEGCQLCLCILNPHIHITADMRAHQHLCQHTCWQCL